MIITVKEEISPTIGALGKMRLKPGLYAYVGSAQSNLESRVGRHLRKKKHTFWHIDYLLSDDATEISKVFFKNANRPEECSIAKTLDAEGEYIRHFGSSDCKCRSHLFRIKDSEFLYANMRVIYDKQSKS